MARVFVLLVAVLLAPAAALACTCARADPFTMAALDADLVVLAEVRGHDRHGMDVAVLDVLRGRYRRRVLRVWGDTGGLCRPTVRTTFPIGTRWVLAVSRSRTPGEGDHAISFCGEYWLEVYGDRAMGRITLPRYGEAQESAPLSDVLAWVRSGGATPLVPVLVR